ncbi:MAG TPA: DUF1127 domain-containing protein [Acetobacteraceae bacterium]|nr:DUF1127 domain-containing protein [Acetobacteraceae bacterium]
MSDRVLNLMSSAVARQTEALPARTRRSWIPGMAGFGAGRSGWPVQTGPQGLGAWLRAAWRRHRSRQQIARLDAQTLRDIGVSYAEAENEANKPFWRR